MTNYLSSFALFLFCVPVSSGQSDKAGTYRRSGLFEEEFLYIGDRLALCRSVHYYTADTPTIYYSLSKARWLNEPELSGQTGDIVDAKLVQGIRSLAWVPLKKILVGKGINYEEFDRNGDDLVFFFIRANTKELTFCETEADLREALILIGVTEFSLVGSELYYRKLVEDMKEIAAPSTILEKGR